LYEIYPDDGIAADDGSGSDDEYSDDDDMSWKVRRAAAKCIEAAIISRHEKIEQFYRTISPALITRYLGVIFQQL
jgi:cullin-associated NEDD8-dissociated protein 1